MTTTIACLHRNLRLCDNAILHHAAIDVTHLVPLYLESSDEDNPWPTGSASRWWLHHSLNALADELRGIGSDLAVRRGPWLKTLLSIIDQTHAHRVVIEQATEPWHQKQLAALANTLRERDIDLHICASNLFAPPAQFTKADGTPYRVYTPFAATLRKQFALTPPLPAPTQLPPLPPTLARGELRDLALLPTKPWDAGLRNAWQPGEAGAQRALDTFIDTTMTNYAAARDIPARPGTSRLSPHLHFGEISVRQIAWRLQGSSGQGSDMFHRELLWREFAYHVLWHFPHTTDTPMNARFADFPWRQDHTSLLHTWQRGLTGIPIVDAGMRELWHTGSMHNRVRMITASFLTKHCRIAWQHGARWFWDTLVDADLASNSLNWQWVAGCGVDAAPYFRIFNPVRQGEKFDPQGAYVRQWIPALRGLPDACVHQPWTARGGTAPEQPDYPRPILDLDYERNAALAAYRSINGPKNQTATTKGK